MILKYLVKHRILVNTEKVIKTVLNHQVIWNSQYPTLIRILLEWEDRKKGKKLGQSTKKCEKNKYAIFINV